MRPRTMSQTGLHTLVGFEGMILHVYLDAAGIATICEGHVIRPGEDWSTVTPAKCEQALGRDVGRFERAICEAVRPEISQPMFDACGCLAFNIGAGAFQGSRVCYLINAGDFEGAADAFKLWANVKVKQQDGSFVKKPILLGRREAESQLFRSGIREMWPSYPDMPAALESLLARAETQLLPTSQLFDPRTGYEIPDNDARSDDGRLIVIPPDVEEAA